MDVQAFWILALVGLTCQLGYICTLREADVWLVSFHYIDESFHDDKRAEVELVLSGQIEWTLLQWRRTVRLGYCEMQEWETIKIVHSLLLQFL